MREEKYKKKRSRAKKKETETVTKFSQLDPELEKKREIQKRVPNQIQEQFSSSKRSSPASVKHQRRKTTGKALLTFPSAFRECFLHEFECYLTAIGRL